MGLTGKVALGKDLKDRLVTPDDWRRFFPGRGNLQANAPGQECRDPPREIPPMTKVMRKRPDKQKQIRPRGDPLNLLKHLPQNQNLSYYFVPFTNSSDINRGLSLTTFLWKKST